MEKIVLAISGKPGLFSLVSRGSNTLIVETVDEQKRRFAVGLRERVTSLNDVSMYTDDGDVKLETVFLNLKNALNGEAAPINPRKASKQELQKYMEMALPNYDRDRVYPNDMCKLISWYNILVTNGIADFQEEEEETSEE